MPHIPHSHNTVSTFSALTSTIQAGTANTAHSVPFRPAPQLKPPAIQFRGLDDRYFKMIIKLSLGFWAGLTTAVGGGYLSHHINQRPAVQAVKSLETSFRQDAARIKESAAALAQADPAESAEKVKTHQAMVQEIFINEALQIEKTLGANNVQTAAIELVNESTLTAEDKEAVTTLMKGNGFTLDQSPRERALQFADTVYSKHADAATVKAHKAMINALFDKAGNDRALSTLMLTLSVLGGLASSGLLAVGLATGGTNIILFMGPMMLLAMGRKLITDANRKSPKNVAQTPPATPPTPPSVPAADTPTDTSASEAKKAN